MYPRRLWSNASRCSMPTRSTTSSPSNAARAFTAGCSPEVHLGCKCGAGLQPCVARL